MPDYVLNKIFNIGIKKRKRGRRGLLERSEDTPMTARAQADYFLRCIREARRGISEIEIEEIAFRRKLAIIIYVKNV
jgi:hypothetical protein